MSYVVNPESIGNPDETPIVQLEPDEAAWFRDPKHGGCTQCNGINWFHQPECPSLLDEDGGR